MSTEALRREPDAPEVILLTTFDADELVLRALQAGAGRFLLKDTPPAEIVRALRLVAAGEAMPSPTVTRQLLSHVVDPQLTRRRARSAQLLARLSEREREREVAVAVGRGRSNAEIGAELYLSLATVKAHVSRLLTKLEVTNRVQIALLVHDGDLGGQV